MVEMKIQVPMGLADSTATEVAKRIARFAYGELMQLGRVGVCLDVAVVEVEEDVSGEF